MKLNKINQNFIDKIFENILNNNISNGIVIASPSKKDPNYFYHWTRDSALVMKNVAKYYKETGNLQAFKQIIDYIEIETHHQNTETLTGLGEPKFNVKKDNSAFNELWGRPQNDSPALRGLTMLFIYDIFDDYKCLKDNIKKILDKDLEYLIDNIDKETYDLWEEIKGFHLFTTCVQYKFIKEYKIRFNNNNYNLQNSLDTLRNNLNKHSIINNSFNSHGNINRLYDSSLFLCLNAINYDLDIINIFNEKFKNYVLEIVDFFKNEYSINKNNKFIFIGRYKDDKYYGGHPWIITTTSFLQLLIYYSKNDVILLENQEKMILEYINYILKFDNLDISEQIDKNTGTQLSAKNLTWNYSELYSMWDMLV